MVFDGHTLEMLPGQSTEGAVSVKMIHGLIKCRQVKYDFYNEAMSPAYGMNSYMSLSFVSMELK